VFKTIVVGFDGSSGSEEALATARELALTGVGMRIALVHVAEWVGGKGGVYPLAIDEDRIDAEMKAKVEDLRAAGVDGAYVIEHVTLGGPAKVIADAALRLDADLIVVGKRGHSPIADLLTGSVPSRLIDVAHRPVLVVPLVGGPFDSAEGPPVERS
jgi:nucleotide-binding universal stress UspA family protein